MVQDDGLCGNDYAEPLMTGMTRWCFDSGVHSSEVEEGYLLSEILYLHLCKLICYATRSSHHCDDVVVAMILHSPMIS